MSVPIEFGTLPLGVEFEGERCCEFSLRPLQARDSLQVRHSQDYERVLALEEEQPALSSELMGLALIGKRLQIDGVPDEAMDLAFMKQLWDDDLAEIMAAEKRLQEALARFRGEDAAAADSGVVENGDSLEGGAEDAAGRSTVVAGGLGGDQDAPEEREDREGQASAEDP